MKYENVKINSKRWLDPKLLLNEEFKDIKGFEGLYQLSNYGRIKSLEKYIRSAIKNNSKVKRKEFIKKLQQNKLGYLHATLGKEGKTYNINIHYEIAKLFLDKKHYKKTNKEEHKKINLDKLEVNHKDENPSNCRIDNLEWCTHSYNINYGTRNKKVSKIMKQKCITSIAVLQYDMNGNFINRYESLNQAGNKTNTNRKTISLCCKGLYKQAGGYIWKFEKR